ncbi:MFS transporter [Actinoplanes sp. NPDC023714]|uniref:MFS transporter n=1 Tax=Actinoplanes sp. NPDC023714 TaxID=3154322 RepID=UPI0033CC0165
MDGTLEAPRTWHARRMLGVATLGYLLSAWAWALLAPLAPLLRDTLGLTPIQQALVVSLPVVVGSLARFPVGALSDRLGSRTTFLLVVVATLVVLLVLATVVDRSAASLLTGAALLGVAGTMFAVAVPFVSAEFAGPRRGLALGLLGTGLCGGALGGLTTVRLVDAYGLAAPFLAAATAVTLFGLIVALTVRDDAGRAPARAKRTGTPAAALRLPITWRGSLWNAVTSALFVTFSSYLPVYLTTAYGLGLERTGHAMAGIIAVAVLMRPVGGWLADRLAPRRPLAVSLTVLTGAVAVQACTPPLPVVAVVVPVLGVALGIASGAILAHVAREAPPEIIGGVSGVVTGIAGLAGFASPLLMAASLSRFGGYGPALAILAAAPAVAAVGVLREASRAGAGRT